MGMEDELWSFTQQSRSLQDLRSDIRAVWDDEAARQLNGRFLEPHRADDDEIRRSLRDQRDTLTRMEASLGIANQACITADDRATEVREALDYVQKEITDAGRAYDLGVAYESDAKARLPMVQACIDRANAACG